MGDRRVDSITISKNVKLSVMNTNTNHNTNLLTNHPCPTTNHLRTQAKDVIQVRTANTTVVNNDATRIASLLAEAREAKEVKVDTTVESSVVVTTVAKEEKDPRVVSHTKNVKSTAKVISDGRPACGTMKDTHSDTVATRTPGGTPSEEVVTTTTGTTTGTDTEETMDTIPDTDTVEREENTTHPCTHHPSVILPLIATEDTTAAHKKTVTKSVNTSAVEREEKVPKEERVVSDTKYVKQSANLSTNHKCHITDRFKMRTRTLLRLRCSLFV